MVLYCYVAEMHSTVQAFRVMVSSHIVGPFGNMQTKVVLK